MNNIKRKKFNISILGESRVGKTSMIKSLRGMPFDEFMLSTIGIDSFIDLAVFDGQEYAFKIFDTAGQEKYKTISSSTIKISDGFLMVFSVDCANTFEKINYWFDFLENFAVIGEKPIVLVGNKIDVDKREVTTQDGNNLAKEKQIKYFETSAKNGSGIKEAFNQLYQEICYKLPGIYRAECLHSSLTGQR
mgnify:CR=1 FL=1